MIDVNISSEMDDNNISLGLIQAKVKVSSDTKCLDDEFERISTSITDNMELKNLIFEEKISDARFYYKKIGKEPSRYRVSSEALMRRLLQGKDLYRINTIVDINNLVSLISRYSVGSYDCSMLKGPVTLTIGQEGSQYQGIGKGFINVENLPVLKDQEGYFGSPTSDSRRAMITGDTKEILMCIYSFSGNDNLINCLEYGKQLLKKYSGAEEVEMEIIG